MAARSGAKHHNTTLTTAKVRQIRKSWATGKWTQVKLADKYKVSQSAISGIVHRRTWKDVA